jgi:hypothetical protein
MLEPLQTHRRVEGRHNDQCQGHKLGNGPQLSTLAQLALVTQLLKQPLCKLQGGQKSRDVCSKQLPCTCAAQWA